MKYILASQSPRRIELLSSIVKDFEVIPAEIDEGSEVKDPSDLVKELSLKKAMAVEAASTKILFGQDYIIIGADTVVDIAGQTMGKPENLAKARLMVTMLSGHTHQVYTGVTIIYKKGSTHTVESFTEKTDVTFYPIDRAEMDAYMATGEAMDKAGAYGIQGEAAKYIKEINGDYNNVVGLPVSRIYQYLKGLEGAL